MKNVLIAILFVIILIGLYLFIEERGYRRKKNAGHYGKRILRHNIKERPRPPFIIIFPTVL